MSDGVNDGKTRIQPGGLYKHFKGGLYVVIGSMKCSDKPWDVKNNGKIHYVNIEDGEHYHRAIYGDDGWLTPKLIEGKQIERFTFVGYATFRIDERGRYHVERTL